MGKVWFRKKSTEDVKSQKMFDFLFVFFSVLMICAFFAFQTYAEQALFFFNNFETSFFQDEENFDETVQNYFYIWNGFTEELPREVVIQKSRVIFSVTEKISTSEIIEENALTTSDITDFQDENQQEPVEKTEETALQEEFTVSDEEYDIETDVSNNEEQSDSGDESLTYEEEDSTNQDEIGNTSDLLEKEEFAGTDIQVESYTEVSDEVETFLPASTSINVITLEGMDGDTTENMTAYCEVMYTLDGVTWQYLGTVPVSPQQEVSLELPQLEVEAFTNLEIGIVYSGTEEDQKSIFFDAMRLEIEFEPYIQEEIVEPLEEVAEVVEGPSFDSSAIITDIHSGKVRVVLLEKGGMLDFWYSVYDSASHKTVWTQLLANGSIDESSPIEIDGMTILWLDKNKQTIFGYNITEQSIFGTSFTEDEETIQHLQFKNENGGTSQVQYDSIQNVLIISNVSL